MRALAMFRPQPVGGRPRVMTWLLAAVGCVLVAVASSSAATLTFSLVAIDAESGTNQVVVLPGAEVPYILTALITYEGTQADNAGLAFFSVNIRTNLQVTQQPLDSFDSGVALAFPILQSLGTPREGPLAGVFQDILDIGGSQNTFGGTQAIFGVALLETQVLGQGRLLTPQTQGTFTAGILDTSTANVFRPNSNSVFEPEIAFGPPITIITQLPDDGDDDDDDDDTNGDTNGDEDGQTPTTQPAVALPGVAALTLFAVIAGLIGLLLWGDGLLLFLGPILVVILLVMVCLGQW